MASKQCAVLSVWRGFSIWAEVRPAHHRSINGDGSCAHIYIDVRNILNGLLEMTASLMVSEIA